MNTDIIMYDKSGAITNIASISDETLEYYKQEFSNMIVGQIGSQETQYVADGVLCDFTPEEIAAKSNLPPGWVWKMPDRIAIDPRTDTQRAADALSTTLAERQAAYPPLSDLADATYWQAQGDPSKMAAYIAAVEAVKLRFPK